MGKKENCSICQEKLKHPAVELHTCKHRFHESCMDELIEQDIFKCPNCMRPFKKSDIELTDDLDVREKAPSPKSAEILYKALKPRVEMYKSMDEDIPYENLPGYDTLPEPEKVKFRTMASVGARRRTRRRKTRRNKIRKS